MAMRRGLRWLLGGLGALTALVLLAALLLPLLYDPKSLGPLISGQIQKITGRNAALGTIALRALPAPAVSAGPLTVSEGPRYPGREALRIERVSIRLRLLPLLRGRLEFGTIIVDGPTLTLIRDRQGRWNYDDILARTAALRAAAEKKPAAGRAPSGGMEFAVAQVVVRGGRVLIYDDAVVAGSRTEVRVDPVDAVLHDVGMGEASRMDLSVGLGKSTLRAAARLHGKSGAQSLDLTIPASRLETVDLATLLPWLGVARPSGLTLGGAVTVDGTATVPLDQMEAVAFEGNLVLDDLSYRDATMTRPIERIGGRLRVSGQQADWEGFTATFGSSQLRGSLRVQDFLRPRIGFKLEAPRLDVNELTKTFAPAAPSGPATARPAAGDPGAGLVQVSANGTLSVGALRFETFDLSDVRATVTLRSAVLSLSDLQAKLYGGRLSGSCSLDLSRRAPGYRVDGSLDGVDVNALAAAYDPGLKDLLRGGLGGRLGLDASGADLDAIVNSARGTANLEIARGALTSFSILKQLASLLEMAGGKGIGKDETPFESLRGSFTIGAGRAQTTDLTLDSADLDLSGVGSVGLDAALDLALTARFSQEASRGMVEKTSQLRSLTDSEGNLVLHLLAKGGLAAPKISLDTRAQMRQLDRQKREEVKEKLRGRLVDLLGGKKDKDEQAPPPE
jgi:AsmA protein